MPDSLLFSEVMKRLVGLLMFSSDRQCCTAQVLSEVMLFLNNMTSSVISVLSGLLADHSIQCWQTSKQFPTKPASSDLKIQLVLQYLQTVRITVYTKAGRHQSALNEMVSKQIAPEVRTTQARVNSSVKRSMFATIRPMPDSGIIAAPHQALCLSLIAIWKELWYN